MTRLDSLKERLKTLNTKKQEAIDTDLDFELITKEIAIVERDLKTEKKNQDKKQVKDEQKEEREELSSAQIYEQFCNARDAMSKYQFGFIRRACEYFLSKTFVDRDKKDPDIERYTTEIENYSTTDIGKAFIELEHAVARNYLRKMVEGQKITVKNPVTDEFEVWEGPQRIYHKLVNTIHIPDPDTYNIVNLSNIIRPDKEEHECPWILKCLMTALGAGKEENIEYVEKYIYSCAVGDIGNNQTPFPVFYGKGKMGKNALFELVLPAILGKECVFASTWDVIGESNFTQFKLGKVLMFVDEIPERSEWTKIKSWTGSVSEYVKIKYGFEYCIDNIIVLAFGSNETSFPLPFEDGEQMQRVSPLKAGDTTFAEYVFREAEAQFGTDFLPVLLTEKIGFVPETQHMAGDKFLRNFKQLWLSRDVIQQFVNYLDTKYNPGENKNFVLVPLRGTDWEDLVADKKDYVHVALDWCMAQDDYLVVKEAFDVYSHICKDSGKKMIKQWDSFSIAAATYLKKKGWTANSQCVVTYKTSSTGIALGQSKNANQRVKVWFKDSISNTVPSLINKYYAQVSTPKGSIAILSDKLTITDYQADNTV